MKYLHPIVIRLSMVSLFTDMASEMLYPIMPVYLKSIGFSIILIGVLEGIAEAVAGFSKGYFGNWSDHSGKRLPFVQIGYSLSAISKPLIGLFSNVWWIFGARTMDRLGKGIRTGARDAMLSDVSSEKDHGKVFGFHRSMDTLGAVAGPALALLFLYYYPGEYSLLFFIAFIPGVLAVVFTFLIHESGIEKKEKKEKPKLLISFSYLKTCNKKYLHLFIGILIFSLMNSSDVFLLLKAKESGQSDENVILMYILYNASYALLAWPFGIIADKIGLRTTFISGLIIFTLVYVGFAFAEKSVHFIFLFLFYGGYAALTDGIGKAWIVRSVPKDEKATAIGTLSGWQSIATMMASFLAGAIWYSGGSAFLFLLTGLSTFIAILYLLIKTSNE